MGAVPIIRLGEARVVEAGRNWAGKTHCGVAKKTHMPGSSAAKGPNRGPAAGSGENQPFFSTAALIRALFASRRKMDGSPERVVPDTGNRPLPGAKIFLDIPSHLDIEQTQNDMTSGHIVTAVHDQWRLLAVRICAPVEEISKRKYRLYDKTGSLGQGASGSSPESGILPSRWSIGVAFSSILFINTIEYLESRSSVIKLIHRKGRSPWQKRVRSS